MKILKHGKVEQRKFVCPDCGCVFVASNADFEHDGYRKWAICPQEGCERNFIVRPDDGEPYEEPTQDDVARLYDMICRGCVAKPDIAYAIKTDIAFQIAKSLLSNGVTFREE